MTSLVFRTAGAADADIVAELHAESWRRHYRGAYADDFLDGDVAADRRAVWSARLTLPTATTTVALPTATTTVAPPTATTTVAVPARATVTVLAEVDGAPAGFVHVILDDDAHWGSLLDNLHVRHGHQRRGVGSALMTHAAHAVAEAGTTDAMYLWVLEQNTAAQAFYTAQGGRPTERALVQPPGGVPARLHGQPAKLRYIWPTVRVLTDFDQPSS